MSSISGIRCPMCGDDLLHVFKTDKLIEWELTCWMCGHRLGPGSYWSSEPGGWRGHCERMGWTEELKEFDDNAARWWNGTKEQKNG